MKTLLFPSLLFSTFLLVPTVASAQLEIVVVDTNGLEIARASQASIGYMVFQKNPVLDLELPLPGLTGTLTKTTLSFPTMKENVQVFNNSAVKKKLQTSGRMEGRSVFQACVFHDIILSKNGVVSYSPFDYVTFANWTKVPTPDWASGSIGYGPDISPNSNYTFSGGWGYPGVGSGKNVFGCLEFGVSPYYFKNKTTTSNLRTGVLAKMSNTMNYGYPGEEMNLPDMVIPAASAVEAPTSFLFRTLNEGVYMNFWFPEADVNAEWMYYAANSLMLPWSSIFSNPHPYVGTVVVKLDGVTKGGSLTGLISQSESVLEGYKGPVALSFSVGSH